MNILTDITTAEKLIWAKRLVVSSHSVFNVYVACVEFVPERVTLFPCQSSDYEVRVLPNKLTQACSKNLGGSLQTFHCSQCKQIALA
jgi:hypothetical protein